MKTSDILKRNLPEFQQGSPDLDSYLDAAGEFLDGTKEAIENLDNVHDYKNSTDFFYENTLKDRGFVMPSRIIESEKRRVLRDMSEIHRKNGTIDGIIHAVRMAGLNPTVRIGWVPSPRALKKGFMVDPVTFEETRYDVNRFVYTKMLYGDITVKEDGTYFEGYRYEDILEEDLIGPLPILGERYEDVPAVPIAVAKSPYIIVKFDEGNKTIVTDPVTDPVTGEVFEYSVSEEFQLISDALKYFLIENQRPTTLRVIIIISLQPFEEEMTISEEYGETHTYNPDGLDDVVELTTISDALVGNGEVSDVDNIIGSLNFVGSGSPHGSRHSGIDISVGDTSSDLIEVYDWNEYDARTYYGSGGDPLKIPLRGETDIWFTPPTDDSVRVVGYRFVGDVPSALAIVPPSTYYFLKVPVEFHYLEVSYVTNAPGNEIEIGLHYRKQHPLDEPESGLYPETIQESIGQLNYRWFKNTTWTSNPTNKTGFDTLFNGIPEEVGTSKNFVIDWLSAAQRPHYISSLTRFSWEVSGYLIVTEPGMYQFLTRSDDGNELFIGKRVVTSFYGSRSLNAGDVSQPLYMDAGAYPFRYRMQQGDGGCAAHVSWKRPSSSSFEAIPSSSFSSGDGAPYSFYRYYDNGITNGLLAYYPLTTNAKDLSGNGYDGENFGVEPVVGGIDDEGAMRFTASQKDFIRVSDPYVSAGSWTEPEASVVLWVKPIPAGISGDQNLITVENTFEIAINASVVTASVKYATNPWIWKGSGNQSILMNRWNMIVLVHSLGSRKIYVNGVLDYSVNDIGPLNAGRIDYPYMTIGARYNGLTANFNGEMNEVKIYNRPLTEEEIAVEYNRVGVV